MTEQKKIEPDIFSPYILLEQVSTAGVIKIRGGHCSDMEYQICGGSPYQAAYNDAFKLAVTAKLPLWTRVGWGEPTLLYHPDVKSLEPKTENNPQ